MPKGKNLTEKRRMSRAMIKLIFSSKKFFFIKTFDFKKKVYIRVQYTSSTQYIKGYFHQRGTLTI